MRKKLGVPLYVAAGYSELAREYYKIFSNSLIIHQVLTKEIMTVTVFGYLILISTFF